jgi:hypothetical protein
MNLGMTRRARMILLGSVLLLLSLSGLTILHGLSTSSPAPPVSRLMPTLSFGEVNGDSQVNATLMLGNGCLHLTSWGSPVQSGNSFSVVATVTDVAGPDSACTLIVQGFRNTYNLGRLVQGSYIFALSACISFPQYGGVVDCSNKASIFFQAGISNPKPTPPTSGEIKLEYQEINGISFVNATIVVPPCFRMRGWSDPSQSGNSFRSNVTIVDDTRLMIACIAIDTLAHNSYNLGDLAPGVYSFTLDLCEVVVGWGATWTANPNINTDCSNTSTILFVVPGTPMPQPSPPNQWYMIFGLFAIIIIIILRILRIPFG